MTITTRQLKAVVKQRGGVLVHTVDAALPPAHRRGSRIRIWITFSPLNGYRVTPIDVKNARETDFDAWLIAFKTQTPHVGFVILEDE